MLFRKLLPSADNVVDRLLRNEKGQLCVSILLGLGLASVFRRVCKDSQCRVVRAAPMSSIKDKTFDVGGRCVKYVPYNVDCNNKNKNKETPVHA